MIIKIVKEFVAVIKGIDEDERTLTALVSTGEKDRVGEYIPPEEWKLTNYEKNPVILWAHNYSLPPVAKALWTKTDKTGLIQKIQFAKTAFANDIFELYKGGFLNAFSVGFQSERDSADSNIFRNCELLEVSCVPVPCNSNALVERLAAGLIKSPEGIAFAKTFIIIPDKKEEEKVATKEEAKEEIKKEDDAASKEVVKEITKLTIDMLAELKNLEAENEILKRSLDELFVAKEGRVLSRKNRELIKTAVDALKILLEATDPNAEEGKSIDKRGKFVIINNNKTDAPKKPGISAKELKSAIENVNIAGLIRGEIKRIKGEVE